jgi:hypothetical protein
MKTRKTQRNLGYEAGVLGSDFAYTRNLNYGVKEFERTSAPLRFSFDLH